MDHEKEFAKMVGKTIVDIYGATVGSEEIIFTDSDGVKYRLYHSHDCCETVDVNDVCGDITDLIGSPITMAEESISPQGEPKPEYPDSWTWTFYKFATLRGYVTIKWLGESNGYYSETVYFEIIAKD